MFAWLMNPLMLGLGALAVASPIIIHLLNRRRFNIVDWAAMDFLMEADKKNRRRVQIENLLLLLLRCLAMLLIGLLLARPFLPSEVTQVIRSNQKFERLFLVDDSFSTEAMIGQKRAIDQSKDLLVRLVEEFAQSRSSEDWLTVTLTSNPDQPFIVNEPVTEDTLPSLLEKIEGIQSTDRRADYVQSLTELQRIHSKQSVGSSSVVYILSDLRKRDWYSIEDATANQSANQLVNRIADECADCYVVDVANDEDQNLAITRLRPIDLEVGNRVIRYAATVRNFGNSTVNGLKVAFRVNGSAPQYQTIANLLPDQEAEVVFPYLFPATEDLSREGTSSPEIPAFNNFQIVAEIDRQALSQSELKNDLLQADSQAFCASRIFNSIPTLLVDGDPSAIAERSETHYLNCLNVLGTGLNTVVATVTDLETASLSNYKVIFLCNIDEISTERIETLSRWVDDGGNLVFMPGNKIRAERFNQNFYKDGTGISPFALEYIAGDPTVSTWVNFDVSPQIHPALRTVVQSDQTSLSRVDVFSWWTSSIDESEVGKSIEVPIRLTDDRNSPAMVERTIGRGKVVAFSIPADGDWTMWPSSPTFAPVMIDLIDYLVGSFGQNANTQIGGQFTHPLDLSVYESQASLKDPDDERIESVAQTQVSDASDDESVLSRLQFTNIAKQGFYELSLRRHSESTDRMLFAANIDSNESDLSRLEETDLEGDFFLDQVHLVDAKSFANQRVSGGDSEIWPQVVWLLLLVLASEQVLAWWFGTRR